MGLNTEHEHFLVILGEHSGDFSSSQQGVDEFEEAVTLDFLISDNEGNLTVGIADSAEEFLDIFHEGLLTVGFGKSDLEEAMLTDVSGELGEGLLSGTTNTDE